VSTPGLPFKRAEGLQVAERWCREDCTDNRFWNTADVMWFCTSCKFWYHLNCCKKEPLKKKACDTIEDLASMPLLKGGDYGYAGTAPVAWYGARAVERAWANRLDPATCNWREHNFDGVELLYRDSAEELLNVMAMGGLLDTNIICPGCV